MRRAPIFPITLTLVMGIIFVFQANAQTTAFKYQGSLNDTGAPANGSFQMQFKLFDAVSGGTQIGSTLTDLPVTVANGIFGVSLDFGSNPLSGANRWLEIAIRRNSSESYVILNPREQLTSSPYSVRTISAAMADDAQKLGGFSASQHIRYSTPGTINKVPIWTGASTIDNSSITQVGLNIGLNTSNPQSRFHTVGTSWFQGDTTPLPSAAGKGIAAGFSGEQGYIYGFDYGAFAPKSLILNGPGGNVGIGTTAPTHTLDVNGFFRAVNGAGGNVVSETTGGTNSWAKFWAKTPTQLWSIGTSNNFAGNQLYFSNENAGGGIRMGIMPDGDIVQNLPGHGLPKALLYVGASGWLFRCYNGQTGVSAINANFSTSGCGFSVSHTTVSFYDITFDFDVSQRFFALTQNGAFVAGCGGGQATISSFGGNVVRVLTSCGGFGDDRPFWLVIY